MYIVIICFPVCDVINFEINLDFKLFSHVIKKSGQKFNFLKYERFWNKKLSQTYE